jgi:hypothetical protein
MLLVPFYVKMDEERELESVMSPKGVGRKAMMDAAMEHSPTSLRIQMTESCFSPFSVGTI